MKVCFKRIYKFLKLAIASYLIFLVLMYAFQRELLYLPNERYLTPEQMGITNISEVNIKTEDGLELLSWYKKPELGQKTIVFFHGNASNINGRVGLFRKIIRNGYGLLALEYRGYSSNPGEPDEAGLYSDARAAVNFLIKEQKIAEKDLILFGRSLGTGVAVQMATEFDTDSLVMISPYDSMPDVAQHLYWYLPAKYLLKDKFDSASKAHLISEPVYIFHGPEDRVVPIENGRKLYSKITSEKTFIELEGVGHHRIDYDFVLCSISHRKN